MNWKSRIWKLTGWRTKNERRTDEEWWRTTENLHEFALKNVSEALRKHLGLDFLHRNNFFHPKQLKCIAKGVRDIWNSLPSPIYRKRGEEVAAQLAQASWVASSISNPTSKMFWKAQIRKFENFYLHTHLDTFTPPSFVIYRKVTEALWKHIGIDFLLFFSSFSPILGEICLFRGTGILRKHYGSPESI